MINSSRMIFLLTPAKDKNQKKIVWADNVEDARRAASAQLINPVKPDRKIPLITDSIYSDPTTLCEEITSAIKDIEQFNNSTIHFNYLGTQIHLGKGKAELLEKFFNDD